MSLQTIGKIAAMLMLGGALTGCIDATVEVEITSETTAKTTLTQVMGADFYAMAKMSVEDSKEQKPTGEAFCADGVLIEGADGSATCVQSEEGLFADLADAASGSDDLEFTSAGPGLVRVAVPTKAITTAVGGDEDMGSETRQMVEAFFAGHSLTIRVSGAEITETNMTLAKDGKSAEEVIPFLDVINGTAELPEEIFAVVRVK